MQLVSWAIAATVVVHGGLIAFVATLPEHDPSPPPTVITVREVPRKQVPPPPPPPPQVATPAQPVAPAQPKPVATPKPKTAPPPAAAPTAPAAAPAPTNLGLTMSNSGGGNGPAVAAPAEQAPAPKSPPVAKTLTAAPAASGCSDPIVKPRPLNVVQPAFTQDAKDAGITGKVRVEITISATGEVTNARVIAGLGHGLDEAALEAARASTFSPATQCGVAVETTFTIGMRFQ